MDKCASFPKALLTTFASCDVGEGGDRYKIFIPEPSSAEWGSFYKYSVSRNLKLSLSISNTMLGPPVISVLGQDPNRVHNINSNSFQQHVITTVNGWQFAAFYTDATTTNEVGRCYVNLARRQILPLAGVGEWQFLTFEDYEQTADDGHNAINIGVCKGDGTIHVAFDHHCDQ